VLLLLPPPLGHFLTSTEDLYLLQVFGVLLALLLVVEISILASDKCARLPNSARASGSIPTRMYGTRLLPVSSNVHEVGTPRCPFPFLPALARLFFQSIRGLEQFAAGAVFCAAPTIWLLSSTDLTPSQLFTRYQALQIKQLLGKTEALASRKEGSTHSHLVKHVLAPWLFPLRTTETPDSAYCCKSDLPACMDAPRRESLARFRGLKANREQGGGKDKGDFKMVSK